MKSNARLVIIGAATACVLMGVAVCWPVWLAIEAWSEARLWKRYCDAGSLRELSRDDCERASRLWPTLYFARLTEEAEYRAGFIVWKLERELKRLEDLEWMRS